MKNSTQQFILDEAKQRAKSKSFIKSIRKETTIETVYVVISTCVLLCIVAFSFSVFMRTNDLLSLMNAPRWIALYSLPLEFVIIGSLIIVALSTKFSTWWNIRRSGAVISLATLTMLFFSFAPLPKYYLQSNPSYTLSQDLIVSALRNNNFDSGTIKNAQSIPLTKDFLISFNDSNNARVYTMPSPNFVPKKGDILWLEFSKTDTGNTITKMGLL